MTQMNWLKSSNKLLVFFILISWNSFAQYSFQELKNEYPDQKEIITKDYQSYEIFIDKNKLKIIQNTEMESVILSESGIHNNQESFTYSDLVKLISYDAYSIVNVNGKEKKIKVTQTNEKQSNGSNIFFDDVRKRNLIFTNLEAGAKKSYSYKREFLDPFLLHKFIFGSGYPIKNATFELITDKNINIGYKIFNDPNNSIILTKSEKKGKTVYSWTQKDIMPQKFESNGPGVLHFIPHIDVYIKDYTINNEKIEVLDDVNRLHKYYKGFVDNINKEENEDLKELAVDLTKNLNSEEEKVKAIFYWVKDNIKYIAFENGYEGFIPREANLVFERKFGDCKDMSSIIVTMASYAGIKNVYLCWIGTREIPYSYNELPTPAVDNHMIAAYKNGSKYIFLDATDRETRYGLPTAFIQDKEALINTPNGYEIVKVPIINAEVNQVNDVIKLTIENGLLKGKGRVEYNGFNRTYPIAYLGDNTGKRRFDIIKNLVLKGNNKFKLIDFSEENATNRDLSYNINYDFELDNYLINVDNEIYINLFLNKIFDKNPIEIDRTTSYDFEIVSIFNLDYELTIPENYKVKNYPKNELIDNELMKISITFEQQKNTIGVNYKIQLKKNLINKEDFALWNESLKQLKSNYSESIILSKTK
jgi:hypothetical protein